MRRILCFMLTLVLLFSMASTASAISYSDRARYYLYITSSESDIYSVSTSTDENGVSSTALTSTGTLPAGTPISAGEVVENNYQKVVYMDQSGSTHTVIIRKDVIKSNYVTLDFGGSVGKVRIPKPASANASFIKDYLNYRGISVSDSDISSALGILTQSATTSPIAEGQVAEQNDTFTTNAPDTDEQPSPSSGKKTERKASATPTPAPLTVQADNLLYVVHGDEKIPVTMVELGLARSRVLYNDQEITVATDSLFWETNAAENERLGIIYAPKSGKVSLRKTAKTGSMILEKVVIGTIVRVFDIQSKTTGVYVGDKAGYVLNSALKLLEPVSTYTTGHLTYKGSLTNTHRINFYSQAKESSKKIKGVRAGAAVTILSEKGTWVELDLDGYHGYILSKFVTPDETVEPLTGPEFLWGESPAEPDDSDAVEGEDVVEEEETLDDSEEEPAEEVK